MRRRGAARFPIRIVIWEVPMKRHWQGRRQMQPAADGARRWDRAYMLILGGSASDRQTAPAEASVTLRAARYASCVDGPFGARGKSVWTGREGCIHVSGLLSQPLAAGLDEFRGSTPKPAHRARWRLVPVGLVDPRPCRFVITSHPPCPSTPPSLPTPTRRMPSTRRSVLRRSPLVSSPPRRCARSC